jgi:ABC-2 type transport system permease protein
MIATTHALRAEWTKLRTVRSTTWALLAIAGLTIGVGAVGCASSHTAGGSPGQPSGDSVVMLSLAGVYVAQIAAVAFGVLAICSEYATGTIRVTFAGNPRRSQVLAAKLAIVAALTLGVGSVATVIAFHLGQALLRGNGFVDDNGYPAATLGDAETLRTVAVAIVYVGVLAVLSLGVAAIVRHTATAISVLLGVLFVPWVVGQLLPQKLGEGLEKATPMIGLAAQERGAPIGPWAGLAVTAAWAAAAVVVALWLIRRRDA